MQGVDLAARVSELEHELRRAREEVSILLSAFLVDVSVTHSSAPNAETLTGERFDRC